MSVKDDDLLKKAVSGDTDAMPGDVLLNGQTQDVFVYSTPPATGGTSGLSQDFLDDLVAIGHNVTQSSVFTSTPSLYDVIIITGSIHTYVLPSIPSATLDSYASSGGGLIIFEDPIQDGIVSTSAGACPVSSYTGWTSKDDTIVVDSASPLCVGLGTNSAISGYGFEPTLKSGTSIAIEWSNDGTPMAVTYTYSNGNIVLLNNLWGWYNTYVDLWGGDHAYGYNLLSNAVDYCAGTSGYVSSGNIVSTPINLPVGGSWDTVTFNKTTPAGACFFL